VKVAFVRRTIWIAIAALSVHAAFAAGNTPLNDSPEQWLQGEGHRDFDWRVKVFGPALTYHQRQMALVQARLPVRKLIRAGVSLSDLHFLVKVADREGHWLPGQFTSGFVPPPDVAKGVEIQFFTTFYVQPGTYTVGVVVYDSRNHFRNVWKSEFQVPTLSSDPLTQAARDFPVVEFRPEAGRPAPDPPKNRLFLPVHNAHRVVLDVAVNLSLSDSRNTRRRQATDWMYQLNANALLQIGKVLSQLNLQNGCVRFSTFDILRQIAYADRVAGAEVDWDRLIHSVEQHQQNKIDVHVLERQKETPAMLARFLEKIGADSGSCGDSAEPASHVLVVVSDAFLFPLRTRMNVINPERLPGTRCYYLQLNPVAGGRWDQIGGVLAPLHPTKMEFSDPTRFRRLVARLIAEIEGFSGNRTASP
jgi:hypothetical protein